MSEVAADYPVHGIPLQRISLSQSAKLSAVSPVRGTPTFILIENGKEAGRIIGYSSERGFWRDLEEVIRRR